MRIGAVAQLPGRFSRRYGSRRRIRRNLSLRKGRVEVRHRPTQLRWQCGRLLAALLVFFPIFALAQGTRLWKQSSYESFEKGTPHGVAISSDGVLKTSPAAVPVLTTPANYIWSATADSRGNIYLGTGSPAEVLRVAPDGISTTLLRTKDVSVQAVKIGPDGMLYAATLPNGKVYRIDPNGPGVKPAATAENTANATVVFDSAKVESKPTYIWDLAFDSSGRLYVATGGPAAIYRVDLKHPAAQPEKFFSSTEQHIRTLLFAKDGMLYAGTDGRGLLYRISPDGKGFVLFEAPKQEIPAMALDPQGNLYVAAMGDKGPSTLPPLTVHSEPTVTASIRIVVPGSVTSSHDSTLIPHGTVIYQIAPDGAPRELWASQHDVVYALAWQQSSEGGQSGLLAGSGNQGHLYRIAADGTYADLAHLEAKQATSFAFSGSTLYVATSNLGKLYRLAPVSAEKNFGSTHMGKSAGSIYISQIHDAGFFSQWGKAQVRGSGQYSLFARVGNIEQPSEGWSPWMNVTPGANAAKLPKARFLQWKAVLGAGARLDEVGFFYLPQNVAPVVDDVVVKLHARAPENNEPQTNAVQINFPTAATSDASYQMEDTSSPLLALPERNWATARWKAHDDNGDHLVYSLFYRGDGEANWQLLQKNIRRTYASFDMTRIPDGGYTLRVIASDAPSNPPGDALTGYKDSPHFVVDTTPPRISPVHAVIHNQEIRVAFDAQSRLSTIARAYYSVDAGPWQYVEPMNQISDSLEERYDFTVPVPKRNLQGIAPAAMPTAPDQHVIAIRVVDRAGNEAIAKAVVE